MGARRRHVDRSVQREQRRAGGRAQRVRDGSRPNPVTARDPFEVLGIAREANLEEARAARRRLAFDRHPDRGGSADDMREINEAFDAVVGHLTGRRPLPPAAPPPSETDDAIVEPRPPATTSSPRRWAGRVQYDTPSFVVDALPAEAFEALLIVASWIGEVLVDDPPYLLDVHLYEPAPCWCRLELLPDAGASTVSLTVAAVDGSPAPLGDDVRDVWVHHLNEPGAFV